MERFLNKYPIKSNRMPQWDYSCNGIYFITLVTQNRECNLGQIIKTQSQSPYIELSDFGTIVNNEWLKSFEIRNELFLDEYTIMPNHLHAIVVLDNTQINGLDGMDGTGSNGMDGTGYVETHGRASLRSNPAGPASQCNPNPTAPIPHPKLIRKPKSISSFIAGFKSAINSKIDDYIDKFSLDIPKYNRYNHFFQPDYYDHIIRNYTEHQRIKDYINNNPRMTRIPENIIWRTFMLWTFNGNNNFKIDKY